MRFLKSLFRAPTATETPRLPDVAAAEDAKQRGNIRMATGALEEAAACYREALRLKPDFADALNNLGLVYLAQKKYAEAETFLVQALVIAPGLGMAHYNLGVIAQEQERLDRAVSCYRAAREFVPHKAELHARLGHCLHLQGCHDEAIAALEQALAVDPDYVEAYDNIGTVLGLQGKYDEAIACYRKALALAERPQTHYSLGVVFQALRQWDAAQAEYQTAIELDPDYHQAKWNLALLLLLRGDYAAGFTHYEYCLVGAGADSPRSKDAPHFMAKFGAGRCWRGEPLAGRRLLIWTEQGLGDTLMMLRYLPLLRAAGAGEIEVYCETGLIRLVNALPCALSKVIAKPEEPVAADSYDVHCSTMSLPYLCATRENCVPAGIPYLRVPVALRQQWAARLTGLPGLKVGLVWGGAKALVADALRSIPLAEFAPLMSVPGITWLSLQKGEPAAQLPATGWPIVDWMAECADLLDTAALVSCLDLIICVDTAVAHLAGALGKPVWLLNRYESEWRWGLEREDTPWYPSMRIFRQPALGDWRSVIDRIADELRSLAATTITTAAAQAEACKTQGNTYLGRGELESASAAYRQAIALKPDYADAHNNLGLVYAEQGRIDDALACYRHALALKPDLGQAHTNLGNAYQGQGKLDQALACYRQAVALSPGLPAAHNNLGVHLLDLDRLDEARACFERALALAPDFAEAHNNLGNVHKAQGRLDEALACFERAVALKPDLAKAHNNLGTLFQERGQTAAAYASYREALRIQPSYADAYSNYLLARQYDADCSAAALRAEHLKYAECFEAPLRSSWPIHANTRDPERRLRLGFVSGDLRSHPVGFFLEGVLAHLDRNAFEITLYPTCPRADALTERLRGCGDAWHSLVGLSDDAAARHIQDNGIDILVDLSGHTAENRLPVFARKPAPILVSWLYFSTTGLRAIDYLLCDRHVVPPTETDHFVEQPWYLPDSYLCFTPPREDIPVGPLPAQRNGFVTFGCFNNLAKLNNGVVALWASILRAVPDSRLFLKAMQLKDAATRQATLARFSNQGIAPERLRLEGPSPRADYLASYHGVDIALDPFPFPGGTTTVEALWMGVPVLGRRGARFISHAGESILETVGLPEWIAGDDADYIAKAAARAGDLESLAGLRARLRGQFIASPLCDAPRFARNLDAALRGMWRAYCARS